tara:strand:- start:888 stop:1496 length:609 start_codon:yes stop_codon:yes gene_type:complete
MKNNIDTIFFDLFGVLIGINMEVVINHISKSTKTPFLTTKDIVMGEPFMELERKEINFEEYFNKISNQFTRDFITLDELNNIWTNSDIGELPIVSEIKKLNTLYNIWIITNTTESHIEKLKRQFSFLNNINGIITSESAGYQKPNFKIFKYALNKTKSEIYSTIFIDDNYNNVIAAENMGIISHRYTDFKHFLKFKHKSLFV